MGVDMHDQDDPLGLTGGPRPKGKSPAEPPSSTERAIECTVVDGELARLIREARSATGLSQERIAEKAGISASYLAHIETNRTKSPDRRVLSRLAKALEVEVGPLLDAAGYTDEDQERFMDALERDRNLHPEEKDIIRRLYLSWVSPN